MTAAGCFPIASVPSQGSRLGPSHPYSVVNNQPQLPSIITDRVQITRQFQDLFSSSRNSVYYLQLQENYFQPSGENFPREDRERAGG